MKTKMTRIAIILSVFIIACQIIPQSAATLVWSDNFDDGNYDGWTVEAGVFSVVNGALTTDVTADVDNVIWYPSTTVVGTWNFSFMYKDITEDSWYYIMFMSVNQTINMNYQLSYGIEIREEIGADPSIKLIHQNGNWFSATTLQLPIFEANLRGTWTDFAVSRNSTGGLNVWINGTHTFEVVNEVLDTSEMFVFNTYTRFTGAEYGYLDNIIVDDEPISPPGPATTPEPTESTTPSETPTGPGTPAPIDPMLLAIGGGAVVVLLVVVVIVKRR